MRAVLPIALLFAMPAMAPGVEPVARITTDSREYCAELARRFAALPEARQDPGRALAETGWHLCETGHPRTGVAKLRRALRAANGEHD